MTAHDAAWAAALALTGACSLSRLHRRCPELPASRKVQLLSWTALAAVIGMGAGHRVLVGIAELLGRPWPAAGDRGGSILGALLAGGLAALGYCRWRKLPAGEVFDAAVLPLPLGQAIGRLGCLAAGCCYGKTTSSWLAMDLPGEGGTRALRYPTQLLSSLADLLIFLLLLAFERHRARGAGGAGPRPVGGDLALLFGGLYLAKRFAMEFLRGDGVILVAPLTLSQVLCLAGFVVIGGLWIRNLLRSGRTEAASASATG